MTISRNHALRASDGGYRDQIGGLTEIPLYQRDPGDVQGVQDVADTSSVPCVQPVGAYAVTGATGFPWVQDDDGTDWIDRPSIEGVFAENERMRVALLSVREHLLQAHEEARKPAHRWWYRKRIDAIEAALPDWAKGRGA